MFYFSSRWRKPTIIFVLTVVFSRALFCNLSIVIIFRYFYVFLFMNDDGKFEIPLYLIQLPFVCFSLSPLLRFVIILLSFIVFILTWKLDLLWFERYLLNIFIPTCHRRGLVIPTSCELLIAKNILQQSSKSIIFSFNSPQLE